MRLTILHAAIIMMAAPLAHNAQANDARINIHDRTMQREPVIVIQSRYDFERSISLKLKTDPGLNAGDVLINMLSKIGMKDTRGVNIVSGFDIDLENNLVVAYSGGTSEIIKTSSAPHGLQVISSFRDQAGNFVSPPADTLAVYTTAGKKLCFDYKTIQQAAPKMGITILLDRSGSMAGNIEAVKQSAKKFMGLLPLGAECAVGSFNTSVTYGHSKYQSCTGGGFGFETITASGGTDIFTPLKDAYTTLSGAYFKDYQKAVIVITDGYTINNIVLKKELLTLKKDILTFVYFIGGNKKDDLKDVTDHFISEGGDVKKSLTQYFTAIGQAYKSQKVLNVNSCENK